MSTIQIPSRIPLDDYSSVIGAGEVAELRALAKPLAGRSVVMINSTAVGGGVAEILNRLVPLAEELGINIRWEVMTGGEDFFEVTKSFHNALHGAPYHPEQRHFDIFCAYNEKNAKRLPLDAEFMVIHDPQPAGLISYREKKANHWVWRCHIDLSHPHPSVWNFLENYVPHYDAAIFSSPEFAKQLPIPQYLFYPAIDPLSEKNRDLPPEFILDVLARYGIDHLRPILTQISRFDRLKDPVGVIRAYRIVRRYFDCQLVLAGGGASDDPEGATVLKEAKIAAEGDPDIKLLELPAWAPLEVNALQRASTIVIQKSLREGFGLTRGRRRGRRNSHPDHPQTHRPASPFRRRRRLSDPFLALPSGYCRAPRRTRPSARKGKFPHHPKSETLPHPVSQAWEVFVIPESCYTRITAATPNSFVETKKEDSDLSLSLSAPQSPN
jgi:trehalose synthase